GRHDRRRGAGVRPAVGPHRGVPRSRVHDRLRPEGAHRGARPRGGRRPPGRRHHRGRPHGEDRRRQDLGQRHRPRGPDPHGRDRRRRAVARRPCERPVNRAVGAGPVRGAAPDARYPRRRGDGDAAVTIEATRAQLAADDSLAGRALCAAWTAEVDRWLADLAGAALDGREAGGAALVAVGGYGRGELSLQSDIDVVLLHADRRDIGEVADGIWYPIWDAGLKLGHAVRTVKEALALAADDLDTATALLRVRHLAGDRRLTDELARKAELGWRKRARRWLATMGRRVRERHARAGEVAFLLEPDLKEGRGGLRDVHALGWAQAARSILWDTDQAGLDDAYGTLLDVRVELHRRTGRPGDRLLLQEQDAVADALGHADADALMRAVAGAARTIAWTSDDAWARIES